MPAKTQKRNGKYRIVHGPNNQLVKRQGVPVDGGGHATPGAAEKQARALNRSKG